MPFPSGSTFGHRLRGSLLRKTAESIQLSGSAGMGARLFCMDHGDHRPVCACGGTRTGEYHDLHGVDTLAHVRRFFGATLLLLVRGVLLWIVVPFAALLALAVKPGRRLAGRPVKVGRVIGWADLNLVAALQRSILRPLSPGPMEFVPWSGLSTVTHRVGLTDPL